MAITSARLLRLGSLCWASGRSSPIGAITSRAAPVGASSHSRRKPALGGTLFSGHTPPLNPSFISGLSPSAASPLHFLGSPLHTVDFRTIPKAAAPSLLVLSLAGRVLWWRPWPGPACAIGLTTWILAVTVQFLRLPFPAKLSLDTVCTSSAVRGARYRRLTQTRFSSACP